jgi:prevent-host-death family protein
MLFQEIFFQYSECLWILFVFYGANMYNKVYRNQYYLWLFMGRINLEEDIRPLSEFRANTASMVQKVRKTGRPLVLTQHGKSTVVLLDVRQYQSMLSSMELFDSVQCGLVGNTSGCGKNC